MERYKLKTRWDLKGTGLGGEELPENKQFLEDIESFEESKSRTKADTQKDSLYRIRKKESSRNEQKAMEIFGEKRKLSSKMKVTLRIKAK